MAPIMVILAFDSFDPLGMQLLDSRKRLNPLQIVWSVPLHAPA